MEAINVLIDEGCRVCRRVQAEALHVPGLLAGNVAQQGVRSDLERTKWEHVLQVGSM